MSLKNKTKAEEANLWTLEVEISPEDFEAALSKAFNKIRKRLQYPGFRKGKLTRKMAESVYGESFLYEDALDICYPAAADEAIKESEIDFVGTKDVNVDSISKAEGVKITMSVYARPVAEISDYKGLEVEVHKHDVTDEDVDAKVNELVERNARLIPVEDRPAADGDITVIDFEGFCDGVAFEGGKGENTELTLGSGQFIPGFEEQIVGHNAGEEFDINVTFPEEYGAEDLAGKDAVFHIKLNKIQVKELPEVNDEFAQDAADFDTVDEMRASLREELEEQAASAKEDEAKNALMSKIVNIVEVDVPSVMVDDEVERVVREDDSRFAQQGFGLELYLQYMGMTLDEYKAQIRERCEGNVKGRLALDAIAAKENIEVSDEEVEKEYEDFAASYGMKAEDVKKYIEADDLKKDIRVKKALDFLFENAVITEVVHDHDHDHEADIDVDDIIDAVEAVEDAEEAEAQGEE